MLTRRRSWARIGFVLVVVWLPALVLALALALLAWLSSDSRTLKTLESVVALTTPYRLSFADADFRWSPFHFQARSVTLDYADTNQPSLLAVTNVDLTMPLVDLRGDTEAAGDLAVGSISYYLDDDAGDEPVDLEALLGPLAWLPARIHIDTMHVVLGGPRVAILPLYGVEARRTASGSIAAAAEMRYAQRQIALSADLDWLTDPGGGHRLAIDAQLGDRPSTGAELSSTISLTGSARAAGEELSYDFAIDGTYARVGDIATLLEALDVEIPGDLHLAGRLQGDRRGYVLAIDELALTAQDTGDFVAQGTITRDESAEASLDLQARGSLTRFETLLPVPEAVATLIDSAQMELRLDGTLAEPRLTEVTLALATAGEGRARLSAPGLKVPISRLVAESRSALADARAVEFDLTVNDVPALLARAGIDAPPQLPHTVGISGPLQIDEERASLEDATLRADAEIWTATGGTTLLWQTDVFSLPYFDIAVQSTGSAASMTLTGSVADLQHLDGIVVDTRADELDVALIGTVFEDAASLPAGYTGGGRVRILRTGQMLTFNGVDIVAQDPSTGTHIAVSGQGRLHGNSAEADLTLEFTTETGARAYADFGLPTGPQAVEAQLRLRPAYGTLLAQAHFGGSDLQAVVNADLAGADVSRVNVDLYSADLTLEDLLPDPNAVTKAGEEANPPSRANGKAEASARPSLKERIPAFPAHLTLRAPRLHSDHAELRDISIEVSSDGPRLLLKHFDARYSGGEVILRGAADLGQEPVFASIAGRGIRVPLGALTRDLGLQQSTTGDLSFRGGLTARGATPEAWRETLQGQVGLALADVTVSGAAYDLLMSNILAWLVQGAGARTTTFDCSLADFTIEGGVAQSDSLYIDTPRMLATGKARIDLPQNALDVRIEPRSRTRAVQFPSAVRIRGPLDDPGVSVSPLQATMDLSAQALLLLPSLPLKLLGVGRDGSDPRPCKPAQEN